MADPLGAEEGGPEVPSAAVMQERLISRSNSNACISQSQLTARQAKFTLFKQSLHHFTALPWQGATSRATSQWLCGATLAVNVINALVGIPYIDHTGGMADKG